MSDSTNGRMSPRGAGFLRLWSEKQISDGRHIPAVMLAHEARQQAGAPVQTSAPWSIVLGRGTHSAEEEARLCAYFGVNIEDLERIGDGDYAVLRGVVDEWAAP